MKKVFLGIVFLLILVSIPGSFYAPTRVFAQEPRSGQLEMTQDQMADLFEGFLNNSETIKIVSNQTISYLLKDNSTIKPVESGELDPIEELSKDINTIHVPITIEATMSKDSFLVLMWGENRFSIPNVMRSLTVQSGTDATITEAVFYPTSSTYVLAGPYPCPYKNGNWGFKLDSGLFEQIPGECAGGEFSVTWLRPAEDIKNDPDFVMSLANKIRKGTRLLDEEINGIQTFHIVYNNFTKTPIGGGFITTRRDHLWLDMKGRLVHYRSDIDAISSEAVSFRSMDRNYSYN